MGIDVEVLSGRSFRVTVVVKTRNPAGERVLAGDLVVVVVKIEVLVDVSLGRRVVCSVSGVMRARKGRSTGLSNAMASNGREVMKTRRKNKIDKSQ